MTTILELLHHATDLAMDDDTVDPLVGLRLGVIEHAAATPGLGNTRVDMPSLPDTVAGCVDVVLQKAIALAIADAWPGGDEFLLVLSTLHRELSTEAIPA